MNKGEEEEPEILLDHGALVTISPISMGRPCEAPNLGWCVNVGRYCVTSWIASTVYCDQHLDEWKTDNPGFIRPLYEMCRVTWDILNELKIRRLETSPAVFFIIGQSLLPYFTFGPSDSISYSPFGRKHFMPYNEAVNLSAVHDLLLFHRIVCDYALRATLLFVKHAPQFCKDLRVLIGRIVWKGRIAWSHTLKRLIPNVSKWKN